MTHSARCECGCGLLAPIAKVTNILRGHVKGHTVRFRAGHNRRLVGTVGYRGKCLDVDGRVVAEHIAIASRAIGKSLPRGSQVHHVNSKKSDNRSRNLVICQDHAYHALLHQRTAVVAVGGNPNTQRLCRACGNAKVLGEFHHSKSHLAHGRANNCKACCKAISAARYQLRRTEGIKSYATQ